MNNFTDEERIELYFYYFNENLTYERFLSFRNIILNVVDNPENDIFRTDIDVINKFYFVSLEYYRINSTNEKSIYRIKKYIDNNYNKIFFSNCEYKYYLESLTDQNEIALANLLFKHRDLIANEILYSFKESYIKWYGLHSTLYPSIYEESYSIAIENFNDKYSVVINDLSEVIDYIQKLNTGVVITEQIFLENKLIVLLQAITNDIRENYIDYSGFIEDYICEMLLKYLENDDSISLYENLPSFEGSLKYYLLQNNKNALRTFPKIININKCSYNYHEYHIFYTWENFLEIKHFAIESIKDLLEDERNISVDRNMSSDKKEFYNIEINSPRRREKERESEHHIDVLSKKIKTRKSKKPNLWEKVKNKFTPASSNSSHSNNKDAITLKKISEREIVFQDLEILNTSEI